MPDVQPGDQAGQPRLTARVTPIIHPAAIIRGLWAREPFQESYLRRVAKGEVEEVDVSKAPPRTRLYPTLAQLKEFHHEAQRLGAVSCDIETAGEHVICVGFTALDLDTGEVGSTVVARFRLQGGDRAYPVWKDHLEHVRVVSGILEDPGVVKVFHGGIAFDVPELESTGFIVGGEVLDTMMLAHAAYTEQPKGLQFLATLYLGMPVWKSLVDPEDEAATEKS